MDMVFKESMLYINKTAAKRNLLFNKDVCQHIFLNFVSHLK